MNGAMIFAILLMIASAMLAGYSVAHFIMWKRIVKLTGVWTKDLDEIKRKIKHYKGVTLKEAMQEQIDRMRLETFALDVVEHVLTGNNKEEKLFQRK